MEEQYKQHDHSCQQCHHGCCQMEGGWGMGHHHFRPWRMLLKVIVILFVFWLGMQLGEIKTFMRDSYGPDSYGPGYMMDVGYPDNYGNGYDMGGMMRNYYYDNQQPVPAKAPTGK